MIFWHTDNGISLGVKRAFDAAGYETRSISKFEAIDNSVFYGLLRGTGRAMHIMSYLKKPYKYMDNGYFEAQYVDKKMVKDMTGQYRVVKNDMTEKYTGIKRYYDPIIGKRILIIPPSSNYSANFYDTTPEDWQNNVIRLLNNLGYEYSVRSKASLEPLEHDLRKHDAVFSFNSMAVMKAVEMGLAAFDTHGIFRNVNDLVDNGIIRRYEYNDLVDFYRTKQVTLDQIERGEFK